MNGLGMKDGEKIWGMSPKRASGTSLSDTDTPEHRGPVPAQDSFNCSILFSSQPGHSRHSSHSSLSSVLEQLPEVLPPLDSFDDHLGESMKSCHRRQPSVIVNPSVEQSYTHMLSGLVSGQSSLTSSPTNPFYPVEKPMRNLYKQRGSGEAVVEVKGKPAETSMDVISDCSSILESVGHITQKTIPDCSVMEVNPATMLTEGVEEVAEERVSTIYTNLSSDSSRMAPNMTANQTDILTTPAGKETVRGTSTSPFTRTTNPTESNHFEIDLFDSPSPEFRFEHSVRASGDLSEHQLGALPARAYCPTCQMDVSTRVSFQLPRLPFWKAMCLVGEWLKCCSDRAPALNYQEALHHCRHCKRLLARVSPV